MSEALMQQVQEAVDRHLPGRIVQAVEDRGVWVRRVLRVTLDHGEVVYIKLHVHEGWFDTTEHEARVTALLHAHGLASPAILAVDAGGGAPFGHNYVIQASASGDRLQHLLARLDAAEIPALYDAMGRYYRQMHAIKGPRSGVWLADPDETLPVRPNDHMYRAEIVEGSGRRALEEGCIPRETYDRAVRVYGEHLDDLKAHEPSLVHASAFLWTIHLGRVGGAWQVTHLGALGDVLWWDPAYDLAMLRWPPFGAVEPAWWEAFCRAYGPLPERQRMLLYLVMQRLCAAMGAYMAPPALQSPAWRRRALDDLAWVLDELEG